MDWIVMKAIEKDRARRYESASAFALDIERYLHDEPVNAVAPSAAYRARKFVRRNRGWLTTAGAVAVVVLVGVVIALSYWAQRRQEQAEALLETLFDCRAERLPAVVASIEAHASRLDGRLASVGDSSARSVSDRAVPAWRFCRAGRSN